MKLFFEKFSLEKTSNGILLQEIPTSLKKKTRTLEINLKEVSSNVSLEKFFNSILEENDTYDSARSKIKSKFQTIFFNEKRPLPISFFQEKEHSVLDLETQPTQKKIHFLSSDRKFSIKATPSFFQIHFADYPDVKTIVSNDEESSKKFYNLAEFRKYQIRVFSFEALLKYLEQQDIKFTEVAK